MRLRSWLQVACLALPLAGCAFAAGSDTSFEAPLSPEKSSSERLLVKRAEQSVEVVDLGKALASAEARVAAAGGFVSGSRVAGDTSAHLDLRIPAAGLDDALAGFAALGEERSRSVSALEVTEEVTDLEATLENQRALRDRLRALLARAQKVEEVLAVERELTRLQSEIDAGEARLDRLRRDVALSSVSLELSKKPAPRILGPLGYLAVGTKWLVTKLFVIRE